MHRSDGMPTNTTGDSADGTVPSLANIWHTYFAGASKLWQGTHMLTHFYFSELPSMDSDPAIELTQQNAWGL